MPPTANPPDPRDAALVQCTLAGDASAYDKLIRRYQRHVYNLVYRMLGNSDDAEDLVQETFVKAYGALRSFRQDASFLTWLYKIASNLSIDLMRSRRSRSALSLDDEIETGHEPADENRESNPEGRAVRGAVADIVDEAIMALPDRYRTVVVMRHIQGLSIDEIAEALGKPSGTIKTHLFRARALLREHLRPVLDLDSDGREKPL